MTITPIFHESEDQKEIGGQVTSKWAKVAKRLSDADLLRDGLGDKVRRNIREFRNNFAM
jgi:hypothetical protein